MTIEYYTRIYEGAAPEKMTDYTYRIGPYKSHEEADDAYHIACYHVQPENTSWDYDIEEVGEEEDGHSCAC